MDSYLPSLVTNLAMSNFLVGWVESTESRLFATNQVNPPDYVYIAKSLNPTPDLTESFNQSSPGFYPGLPLPVTRYSLKR